MSRVDINVPDNTHFSTTMPVRIGDVNQGNHLGHDRMIGMIHEARIQFFRSLGYDELDIDGIGTVIADLAVSYRGEAFYGDELEFEIVVQDISRKSCQFLYRITNVNNHQLIALAKTGIVFFDYALRKSAAIPAGFIAQLDKISAS